MKKPTVRDLSRWYLGTAQLTRPRVQRLMRAIHDDGWVASYTPGPNDYDRGMVLVHGDHPLVELMHEARQQRWVTVST